LKHDYQIRFIACPSVELIRN